MALRLHRKVLTFLLLFWSVVYCWYFWQMKAHGVPDSVMESDSRVTVTRSEGRIDFEPVRDRGGARLLFHPGAMVSPIAYTPLAREVALAGYPVTIVQLPWRMAPLGSHKATVVQRTRAVIAEAQDRPWVIGGHSLGARFAAEFAGAHEEELCGLLLVGSSHPRRIDLSHLKIDVTKIYGTNDGLASEAEVKQFGVNLPDATHWQRVEGGNHSQFAWYGYQLGAGKASISRLLQHRITLQETLQVLRRVSAGRCGGR